MATSNTPKFTSESQDEAKNPTPDIAPDAEETSDEKSDARKDDVNMIVSRQQIHNPDGTVTEKQHGPMPVEQWAAYEKEHKL
jgi:hypothetical protein